MQKRLRLTSVATAALVFVIALSACGGSSKTTKHHGPVTITEVMATAPNSLDPAVCAASECTEPNQVTNMTLLAYAHTSGTAGATIIPGLATSLPQISPDGKTYRLTLRSGLRFSNGQPAVASDFTYAVERAIKIPWALSFLITNHVIGAAAYASGKAKTISGITTNDATGQITIRLNAPYGAFSNVLAFASPFAPLPKGTPFKDLSANPPPGVGPYKVVDVVPNVSFSVVRNPYWKPIPGIPSGYADRINVKISSNTTANALSVLNNSADVFDNADLIPPSVLPQMSRASGRYGKQVAAATYYFFLNVTRKPFSSQLAREAVVVALDRDALVRLGSGFFVPGCYLLPPTMVGHATQPCPYGDPTKPPDLSKAKALVQQSGMAGTPVTVYGRDGAPYTAFEDYYTNLLNQIGFKATEKIVAGATYFPTIGNLKLDAQTGLNYWFQDFPNPIDFYDDLLTGNSIMQTNNFNLSQVSDPVINAKVNALGALPFSKLNSVAGQWQSLEYYAAQKAYVAVWGYAAFPKFTSDRIDYNAAVLHQVYDWDWLTLRLK